MLVDTHCHSISSSDGANTVAELAAQAMRLGVDVLAVTDHCDAMATMPFPEFYGPHMSKTFYDEPVARNRFFETKEALRGQPIRLLYGIELGMPHLGPSDCAGLLARQQFDMVIGSVHTFMVDRDVDLVDFDEIHPNEAIHHYLWDLRETARTGLVDTMAHIDYPLRYLPDRPGYAGSYKPFEEEVRLTLRTMVERGVALELNGKSRKGDRYLLEPCVIRWYLEAGGEYMTYGSDAHRADQLLRNYNDAVEYLKSCGVRHLAYFDRRRPVVYSID